MRTFFLHFILKISEELKLFARNNHWLLWLTMAVSILILIVLACCEFHKKYPYNHLSFWSFSVSATAFLMVVTAIYSTQIVFLSLLIVLVSNLLLVICLFQSKIELTVYTGLLVALVGFGIALGALLAIWTASWINILYSSLGSLAFIVVRTRFVSHLCTYFSIKIINSFRFLFFLFAYLQFFMVDTQMMMSGSNKNSITEDDYVFASMTLYTDVINLFIYILQLLNSAKD